MEKISVEAQQDSLSYKSLDMQWYEIDVNLPLPLLGTTYNFLWLYVNGLKVEKTKNGFILEAYLFSSFPHKLLKRLNNFLHIMAKSYHANYSPPVAYPASLSLTDDFIIVPIPTSYIPTFGCPILIQRGKAFGTGNHPCTIYCLQALKDIFREKFGKVQTKQILDAGTGTGILAIAAAKLGAKDITGVEINYESIMEAQENLRLNKVTKEIRILPCSVTEIKGKFNLIFANLYGFLLKEIASFLVQQLAPKGLIILGGMFVPDDDVVISTFTQQDLKECARYQDEVWSVTVLQSR
ncbi:MAG: 50S ribosomal protein L11 methyltransferase [Thermodesulfovibrionales bacterium]|nr:50S ribosomal protein L11 methyltransferase [Thermodesulfovibrionales bacterium]